MSDGGEVVAGREVDEQASRTDHLVSAKQRQLDRFVAHVARGDVHLSAEVLVETDRVVVPHLHRHTAKSRHGNLRSRRRRRRRSLRAQAEASMPASFNHITI